MKKAIAQNSWKTTVGGAAMALGAAMTSVYLFGGVPQWVGAIGAGLSAAAAMWTGLVARDNDVTSEEAGAGQ